MPQDVRHGKADNSPILAKVPVGEEPAQQRQEITCRLEIRIRAGRPTIFEQKSGRQIQWQYRPHAVVGAALGEFSPEDEIETGGMFTRHGWRGADCLTHCLLFLLTPRRTRWTKIRSIGSSR